MELKDKSWINPQIQLPDDSEFKLVTIKKVNFYRKELAKLEPNPSDVWTKMDRTALADDEEVIGWMDLPPTLMP